MLVLKMMMMMMTLKLKCVDGNGLLIQIVGDVEHIESPASCHKFLWWGYPVLCSCVLNID